MLPSRIALVLQQVGRRGATNVPQKFSEQKSNMGAKEQLAQMMEAIQENYEQLPDGLKTTIAQLSTKNLKRSSAEGSSGAAAAGAAAKKT